MNVAIEKEALTPDIFAEFLPLGRQCWQESTLVKKETCAYYGLRDFDIEPDSDTYLKLASQGMVVMMTVREDGVPKGYILGLVYRSMHHKGFLCGIADTAYLDPGYRSYAAVVAEKFASEMKDKGVEIIGWPTHIDGPWFGVLKALGYVGDDIVMEKRLCALQQQ